MTQIKIDVKRLKELERAAAKLNALESGGVDNWEGYDFSLEEYHNTIEREEKIEELTEELLEELCVLVDEPAGHGAGFGFKEEAREIVGQIINKAIEELAKPGDN